MKARSTKAFATAIRQRRRELGLDQSSFARRLGTSRQWVIAIEQGKDSAEIGRVLRAMEALGLTVSISADITKPPAKKPTTPQIDINDIVARTRTSTSTSTSTSTRKAK